MTVQQQAHVFGVMLLCGACIGLTHDLLAVCRRSAATAGAADLLLGLLAAAAMIGAGLALRCDPFRLYAFAGVAAGWTIYAASLGRIVRFLMRKFMRLSNKVTS